MRGVRAFVSYSPPGPVLEEMGAVQERLKASGAHVRWEDPRQLHTTIKFLGDVPQKLLPEVLLKIASAATEFRSFTVIYESLGAFPRIDRPRVLWIGCKNPDGQLQRLKGRLDSELAPYGFPTEERAFHPHVTLGRIKSERGLDHLTPMLEKCTFEPRITVVDEIFVMRSVLSPQGAVHSVIQSAHLQPS